jgi:Na+/H+ antiporter NhaB
MSLTPQFISIELLKDQSVINENVDSKLLQPTLIMVQDIYLKQVVGKELYAELITQINAESVTALNTTLLTDYIQPYLINKVVSELVIDVNYKVKNKALMVGSSDNAQPLDTTGMSIIQTKYRNIAESYRVNLVDYLLDNFTDYPLFNNCNSQSEIPNIFLGNARKKRNRYL